MRIYLKEIKKDFSKENFSILKKVIFTAYFTPRLADFRCPGSIFAVDVSGTCDAFLETVADKGALMETTSDPTKI